MRKFQKTQAEEFVALLGQAHDEIRKAMEKKNTEAARSILADCQDGAIALGELIEKAEGEGFVTISLLEAYCELVYRIYEELGQEQAVNAGKTYKMLRQSFFRIESSVKNDIKVRKEVVFLPYKASMWDSLESIWRAADKDPDCDAYVVPIPYYDKNPDGSFKEMHYEGGEYPKDVPVVWYENYDFEKRKPDVIYIHNPYDNYNIVTSVPPFFFSENLKKYTDKLVYVPYFILKEIKPDNDAEIDGIKHFVITPAVFNAHKVIVQSENMKQVYVKVLLDATNDHSESARKYWNDKILGIGSPKLDKVSNMKKEDLEIPDEWLKIIEKPDGTWKRIIFYNTSVVALLENSEKMLEKMESVFNTFKENKDDIALLWRPHPLIKATIESMRPQIRKGYDTIIRKYREESWGIYDDTSDVDRAVVLSDAYYGDGSSIVQMFRQIGKPMMIQNPVVNTKLDNEYYLLSGWCRDGEYLYFIPNDLKVLVKYSERTQKNEWVRSLYDIEQERFNMYSDIKKYGSKLYFIPMHDNKIVIYDLDTEQTERISIPYSKHWDCTWGNFSRAYCYEGSLYLIGYKYPGIVRLDLEAERCEQVLDYCTMYGSSAENQNTSMDSVEKDGNIYMPLPVANGIVKYNIKRNISTLYELKNSGEQYYRAIAYDGKDFWLTVDGAVYLKWNEESKDGEILTHPEQEKIKGDNLYRYSFFCERKIYVFSSKEAPIVVVDCEHFEQSYLIWKEKSSMKGYRVDNLYIEERYCCFIDIEDRVNRFLDGKTGEITEGKRKKDRKKIIHALFSGSRNMVIKEGGFSLSDFIEMI